MSQEINVSIVGTGPRGLVALERLIANATSHAKESDLKITLFESSAYPGCGPNYSPDQTMCNQLNVPFREIPMTSRSSVSGGISYSAFPSFQHWYKQVHEVNDSDRDIFPARSDIGRYLQERFYSIIDANPNSVTLVCEEVTACEQSEGYWQISTSQTAQSIKFDEVLLAIGHQPTHDSSSLEHLKKNSSETDNRSLFLEPYPNQPLIDADVIDSTSIVALRGMGLSMIDMVKSFTMGRGGEFIITDHDKMTMRYQPSGREPKHIVPFSIDGQPMAPKPINATVDERYDIGEDKVREVEASLRVDGKDFKGPELRELLIKWASSIAASVYVEELERFDNTDTELSTNPKAVQEIAAHWLNDEDFTHISITDTTQSVDTIMQQFLDMATGNRAPSLDFCVGQIWRNMQPSLYECLRFSQFNASVIEAAMELDQRMKRYAFGPPAEAIAMLITIHKSGVLLFKITDDPDIQATNAGWKLLDGEDAIVANVMINTVLDQAQLSAMNSELVIQLNEHHYTEAVHDSLGAKALADGRLISDSKPVNGLSATGRLILGSVFEADALLSCFGDDMTNWACELLNRQIPHGSGASAFNSEQTCV